MRLVLDTNVVVSALLWRGTPYRLLADRPADVALYTSPPLLEELADVLSRPMAVKRIALIGATPAELTADYAAVADIVTPEATPRIIMADADDDHVIAALAGDRHLLDLARHGAIRIVTPAEAVAVIAGTG
ncbi:MAG: putative toxin-antitoxin system toxin component, PIN family [Rhodopila sp.]